MSKQRIAASALVLSFAAAIGIINAEGFTDTATIPTKNDRPTIGYGSTFWEDGRPVKMGEKITPTRALVVMQAHINKEEALFRKSIATVPVQPIEYDIYMDWTYQYGNGAWYDSSMRANLLTGNYVAACSSMLKYKYSGGYDCSTLINGKPNDRCWGVWTRQQARVKKCLEAQ